MLAVSNLTYQWPGSEPIRFPDFQLDAGRGKVLLGGSGSGKTTLLHLLGGFLKPRSGSIQFQGQDLVKMSSSQLDRFRGHKVGFVFQQHYLIDSLSVRQNLMVPSWVLGAKQTQDSIDQLLDKLGLLSKANTLSSQLSYGQQQRLAIARALVHKPDLIIADEPTSALDDQNCKKVFQLLTQLCEEQQTALLVATHDHRLKAEWKECIFL